MRAGVPCTQQKLRSCCASPLTQCCHCHSDAIVLLFKSCKAIISSIMAVCFNDIFHAKLRFPSSLTLLISFRDCCVKLRMYFSVRTMPSSEFYMHCDECVYVMTACALQVDHSSGLAEFCGKPNAETRSSLKIFSLICEVQLHVKVRRHCLDLLQFVKVLHRLSTRCCKTIPQSTKITYLIAISFRTSVLVRISHKAASSPLT
jgi:hypothetical protein